MPTWPEYIDLRRVAVDFAPKLTNQSKKCGAITALHPSAEP
jgi:hypothetical protein